MTLPLVSLRYVLGHGCCKNPVSLQSKHGLAYILDESGVGCLCRMFLSKGGERDSGKAGKRKREVREESEVGSRNFCCLKICKLELCMCVVLEIGKKCWVNNESVLTALAKTCLL